jgi:hypothetical protein
MDFVSPDPEAMVRALNVRATLDAFDIVPDAAKKIARAHQLPLDDLKPDQFVRVQNWLNALKEIHGKIGPVLVRQVGAKIIENAEFPPHFDTVESVLLALDQIYYLNHKGNVGHYNATKQPDGSVIVCCETPYPRDFERGLVEGITRNTRLAKNKRYQVKYTPGPADGNLTCTLHVMAY